jgi:hypothetical protein
LNHPHSIWIWLVLSFVLFPLLLNTQQIQWLGKILSNKEYAIIFICFVHFKFIQLWEKSEQFLSAHCINKCWWNVFRLLKIVRSWWVDGFFYLHFEDSPGSSGTFNFARTIINFYFQNLCKQQNIIQILIINLPMLRFYICSDIFRWLFLYKLRHSFMLYLHMKYMLFWWNQWNNTQKKKWNLPQVMGMWKKSSISWILYCGYCFWAFMYII